MGNKVHAFAGMTKLSHYLADVVLIEEFDAANWILARPPTRQLDEPLREG